MNFDEYQEAARRTLNVDWPERDQLANVVMGLAGEAGELIGWQFDNDVLLKSQKLRCHAPWHIKGDDDRSVSAFEGRSGKGHKFSQASRFFSSPCFVGDVFFRINGFCGSARIHCLSVLLAD